MQSIKKTQYTALMIDNRQLWGAITAQILKPRNI